MVLAGQCLLNRDRALHGINDAWELGQDAVASRIGDPAPVLGAQLVHDLAMRREGAKCSDLVLVHQARVSGRIGSKDRRQPPFDPLRWFRHTAEHSFCSAA